MGGMGDCGLSAPAPQTRQRRSYRKFGCCTLWKGTSAADPEVFGVATPEAVGQTRARAMRREARARPLASEHRTGVMHAPENRGVFRTAFHNAINN